MTATIAHVVLAVDEAAVVAVTEQRRWKRPRCGAAAGEVILRPRLVGRAGTASPCRLGMHVGVW
jgi:hypothetical protein